MENNLLFYTHPDVVESYKDVADRLRDIEAAFIVDAITRLGKPGRPICILDLGCGSGRTSIPLAGLGLDVVALDLSYPLTQLVHAKAPDMKVVCGDAARLPLPSDAFDLVLFSHNSIDLLYPLVLREAALREIARVLRPGGFFVYSSHALPLIPFNLQTLRVMLSNMIRGRLPIRAGYFDEIQARGKLRWYATTVSDARRELSACGMRLVRHSKINFIESAPRTAALAFLSWERYMLVQADHG